MISYRLLPSIWRYAKAHRLLSQPHFLASKYASPTLGLLVAVVDMIALVPYLVLQFKGLGIIVRTASYGAIAPETAIWIGAAVVTAYVTISGVRGSAWNSVIKDLMILGIVVFLGIYLPFHHYGGIGEMFRAIDAAKPGFLTFPAKGSSVSWFDSTVLITALVAVGFTPHGGETIVALLLMGYSFVTQLFPAMVACLTPRRWVTAVGVIVVALTTLTHASIGQWFPALPDWVKDLNIGLVALVPNVAVLLAVSALTQPREAERSSEQTA